MRLAEDKLGEVKLSSRFAGLEELEEQDVRSSSIPTKPVTVLLGREPEPKDAPRGSGPGLPKKEKKAKPAPRPEETI